MPRVLLISNPAAARTTPRVITQVVGTLRAGGWTVEEAVTGGAGDARRYAEQAVRDAVDSVVVFGGDGTTMQAAAALVGTDISLGLIPGGTGNLLAGNLRIPAAPTTAAQALLQAKPQPLDLGRMDRPDGVHYFAVACGAGYDARVMTQTSTTQKQRWGMGAYVYTTLRLVGQIRDVDYLITVDGRQYEARAAMVLVANCGEVIPPYVRLGAGISPRDGVLDLVVVRANSFGQGVRAVWELLRAQGQPLPGTGQVGFARGQEIRLEPAIPQPAQADGEPAGITPITATVVPGAIKVLLP